MQLLLFHMNLKYMNEPCGLLLARRWSMRLQALQINPPLHSVSWCPVSFCSVILASNWQQPQPWGFLKPSAMV